MAADTTQQPQQGDRAPSHVDKDPSTNASLTQELTSTTSPTTPHSVADALRAMSHVEAWKPLFNRRQSWNKEEHKHAMQMSRVQDVKTGPGFTERP